MKLLVIYGTVSFSGSGISLDRSHWMPLLSMRPWNDGENNRPYQILKLPPGALLC